MTFPRKPEHFWPILWGAVALALVAVLVLENRFGRSTVGEGARAPARIAEAKLLPAFRIPPDQLAGSETLARPLFVPSRRPSPPGAGTGGAVKKGQFILQGTTIVGPLSIAMLKEVSSGTVHRVEKGAEIMGMTLAEVSAEQVVLKAGDDSETLPLVVAKGTGTASAAVEHGPFGPPESAQGSFAGAPARPAAPVSATGASPANGGAPIPAASGPAPRATSGAFTGTPPAATSGSAAMTPEEIIARRRAARRPQPQN